MLRAEHKTWRDLLSSIYKQNILFLSVDLEWRILYVGSAESEDYDQVLDTVLVGPLVSGRHKFVFQVIHNNLCWKGNIRTSCPRPNEIMQ